MEGNKFVNYNLKHQYVYPVHGEHPPKCTLGKREGRYCIFCGKTNRENNFKKEAHVIPAALGNRSLTNWNECDSCNEDIFSVCEDDLVNYLALERILIRGRKRNGNPKYKQSNGNSYITSAPGTNQVKIEIDPQDVQFVKFENLDTDQARMTFFNLPPYSYVNICKSLVHMGWSVMENEWEELRKKFDYVYLWLKGECDIFPLYMDEAFIPGGGLSNVILEVLESQEKLADDFPFAFRLSYGHKVITFYLPSTNEIESKPKGIAHLNNVPNDVEINVKQLTILSDERIKPTDVTYGFSFNKHESSDENNDD